MKYYKIVNPKGHNGIIYKEGYNEDVMPFKPYGDCEDGGIYFAREDILAFLEYGSELYEVKPVGEIYENPSFPKKWKAHAVNLKYVGKINLRTIKFLIKQGANVHADNDYALCWASSNGHLELVKYLIEKGADIHTENDYALRLATRYEHFDIVKFLKEKMKEGK